MQEGRWEKSWNVNPNLTPKENVTLELSKKYRNALAETVEKRKRGGSKGGDATATDDSTSNSVFRSNMPMTDVELKTLVDCGLTPSSELGRIFFSLGSKDTLRESIKSLMRLRCALREDKSRKSGNTPRSDDYWENICTNVPQCLWSLYDTSVNGIIYATWGQGSCHCSRCASFNELQGARGLHAYIQKVGKTAAAGAAHLSAVEQMVRRYPLSNDGRSNSQSLWRLSADPSKMVVVTGMGNLTNIHEKDIHKIVLPGFTNVGQHTETVESLEECEMRLTAYLTGAWMKVKGKEVTMIGPEVDEDGEYAIGGRGGGGGVGLQIRN